MRSSLISPEETLVFFTIAKMMHCVISAESSNRDPRVCAVRLSAYDQWGTDINPGHE